MKCGRPLPGDRGEYCENCRSRDHLYTQGRAPFKYGGIMQDSLMRFKYDGRAEYAGFYAKTISLYCREELELWHPQLLVPVPVHPIRYAGRGYNQAELIAEELSKLTGIPTSGEKIHRIKNTRPQKGLSPGERTANLRNAFRTDPGYRLPERVLIIDDIYTTGATVDQLTEVLRRNGAREVWFACVAIALGQG